MSHRSSSRDRELLWKDGSSTTGWLHVYALILGFNSPRKIPLPQIQVIWDSSWCRPSTTADARVSRQRHCHDREPPASRFITVTDSESLVLSWEQLSAAESTGPEGHPATSRRAATAPVWRQGEGRSGRGLRWVRYCRQMLEARGCC